jgi:hypothetical protein
VEFNLRKKSLKKNLARRGGGGGRAGGLGGVGGGVASL